MVNARDFGNGQTALFAKTLVWREDLRRYGQMCVKMGALRPGCTEWRRLDEEVAILAYELAKRAARAEVDAQRYRETVAEEA